VTKIKAFVLVSDQPIELTVNPGEGEIVTPIDEALVLMGCDGAAETAVGTDPMVSMSIANLNETRAASVKGFIIRSAD
jgi:hypothetical protein